VGRRQTKGIYHVSLTWQHTTTLDYFAISWCHVIHNQGWVMEIVNSLVKLLLKFKKI
jgi:hypothetical protein